MRMLLLSLLLAAPVAFGQPFDPGCPLPFEAIKTPDLAIDEDCPLEGAAQEGPHAEQNRAKNNFCAPPPARRATVYTLKRLQRIVDQLGIPYGSSNSLPEDRSVLRVLHKTSDGNAVGEGTLVALVGFVTDAHHSNVSKGESVNCKRSRRENNDIHVSLAESPGTPPCETVAAEISPHFRPAAWDPEFLQGLARPVRIIGPLFFDASHKPCTPGKKVSPARCSSWEVHPVYQIDICENTTIKACHPSKKGIWTPLHEFAEAHWKLLHEEEE